MDVTVEQRRLLSRLAFLHLDGPAHNSLDVLRFQTQFGLLTPLRPAPLDAELAGFRAKFLREEATETENALLGGDLVKVADGLIDVAYVAHGTLHFLGLPTAGVRLNEAWHQVVYGTGMLEAPLEAPSLRHEEDSRLTFLEDLHQAVDLLPRHLQEAEVAHRQGGGLELTKLTHAAIFHAGRACAQAILSARLFAFELHLPWQALWDEVQAANLRKQRAPSLEASEAQGGAHRRHATNIIKPPGWTPPDVDGVLRAHGWEG